MISIEKIVFLSCLEAKNNTSLRASSPNSSFERNEILVSLKFKPIFIKCSMTLFAFLQQVFFLFS